MWEEPAAQRGILAVVGFGDQILLISILLNEMGPAVKLGSYLKEWEQKTTVLSLGGINEEL